MKKKILFFVLLGTNLTFSQTINDNWLLGKNKLHFSSNNLTITEANQRSRAIMSDSNGEMLFFHGQDGYIYNKNFAKIINPTSTDFSRTPNYRGAVQTSIIIPNPLINGEFFLIYVKSDATLSLSTSNYYNLYYVLTIDFNDTNYPLGKIKDEKLLTDSFNSNSEHYSSISAISNANKDGFFLVLGYGNGEKSIRVFNINGSTIPNVYQNEITYGNLLPVSFQVENSMSKISPDGNTIAFIFSNQSRSYVYVADFNDNNGQISNFKLVKNTSINISDIEFSENSSNLFFVEGNALKVRNILNFSFNEKLVTLPSSIGYVNSIQRSTNGDIYLNNYKWNLLNSYFITDRVYKILNSNDFNSVAIDPNNFNLINPIMFNNSSGINGDEFRWRDFTSFPELVPTFACPTEINTSSTSVINSEVKKSSSVSMNLKHTINSSGSGTYSAGNNIVLSNGFHAKSGANVVFSIKDCDSQNFNFVNSNISNTNFSKLSKESIYKEESVSVYPNPFNDYINLDLTELSNENFDIFVYDFTGKLILKTNLIGSEVHKLDLSSFLTGNYIIKILDKDGKEYNYKVIKK